MAVSVCDPPPHRAGKSTAQSEYGPKRHEPLPLRAHAAAAVVPPHPLARDENEARTGRKLVLDLYGAAIAEATGKATIPQAHWDGVRVLVPNAQRRRVIDKQAFSQIDRVRAHRIFPEQLAGHAGDLVLTMRGSMTREIERADCLHGACAVWSMWPGYQRGPGGLRVVDWVQRNDIVLHTLHASGHASVADLRALASAIDPDRVVPIHTAAPERYPDVFSRVEPHADGDWWTV